MDWRVSNLEQAARMKMISALLRFPDRATTIQLVLVLSESESSYDGVFAEIVNAKGRLGVQRAAELCNLSVSRFSHAFSVRLGMPYRTAELIMRMELSAHTVISTSWRMSEIAETFEYSELKKWDTAFRHHFAICPTQYRKDHIHNHTSLVCRHLRFLVSRCTVPGEQPPELSC